MNKNDWVRSYSKGIWQITRIEKIIDFYPSNTKDTTVFCKRFLNEKFKKSFAEECCDRRFIKPLSKPEVRQIEKIIQENPKWLQEFQAFSKPIDSILNLSFYVSDGRQRAKYKKVIEQKLAGLYNGMTDQDIIKYLQDEDEHSETTSIRNFTVQFVSRNSEVLNHKLIYKELKFLDF